MYSTAVSAHQGHHVKLPASPALQIPDPRKGNDNSQHGSKWYKGRKANLNGDADDGEQDGQKQEVCRQHTVCVF